MKEFTLSGPAWFDSAEDPVLWTIEHEIVYRNPSAERLNLRVGERLPADLQEACVSKVMALSYGGRRWTVRSEKLDEGVLLLFREERAGGLSPERLNQMAEKMRLPLGNLYSAIQMLELSGGAASGEKQLRYRAIQKKNYYMLQRMLDSMEMLGKLCNRECPVECRLLDFAHLVGEIAGEVSDLFQELGCRLTVEGQGADLFVEGNEWVLRHMIYQLLSNALSAAEGGFVAMKLQASGDKIRLTVGDSGTGFSEEDMKSAFDEGYAPDYLKPGGGLGLGLSICRYAVEAHGGRIALLSGSGATVVVELPRCTHVERGQLRSDPVDHCGGFSSSLVQLSSVLPWQCFLEDIQ